MAVAGAERRHLTVMFCDMVGSTALSEQFDPEDLRNMIAAYRETCVRVLENYEGFVARYIGDGILVYFGYPNAHEDDAERAVRTGLEIVQSHFNPIKKVTGIADRCPRGPHRHCHRARGRRRRNGEGTEEHDSVVGETPNLAARLQGLAPPNGVIIASSTQSLLRTKFEYEHLGSHALKGLSAPVEAWYVVRSSRVESRFAATSTPN